jgi:hypothetical protein
LTRSVPDGENETVEVITKFRDQPKAEDGHNDGLYVFHCHNLEHEDIAMMGQMLAVRADGTAPSIERDFMRYIDVRSVSRITVSGPVR